MTLLLFISVFFATMSIDAFYALYTMRVTEKNAFQASAFGVLIHLLTAFTVISYTKNYLYLLPLLMGSFIGTYLTIRWSKK